jgi:SAM-dependent methyltransferase
MHTGGSVVEHQGFRAPTRLSLRTRLLFRLVRALDRGQDVSAEEIHRLLGQLPGRVGGIGQGSPGLLDELRRLGHCAVAIELREGELPGDGPPDVFDALLMIQSLEHCLDPLRALEDVFHLLRPGGWFICEVPDEFFTRPGLGEALGQIGFMVARVRRLTRQTVLGGPVRSLDSIRIHARKPLDAGFGSI